MALDAVPPLRMPIAWRRAIRLVADRALGLCQRDLAMVDLGRADLPTKRAVTGGTVCRRWNVARRLPHGDLVVVAGNAATDHLAMVHTQQGNPGQGSMTGLAGIACGWMAWGFARRHGSIVAVDTSRHDAAVIEYCGYPGGGAVAGIAVVGADDMIRRFARRNRAVVAAEAVPGDLGMIDARHRRPGIGAVARIAPDRTGDMVRWLAWGCRGVVAADARPGGGKVVEPGHGEGPDAVTLAAVQVGRHVIQWLAGCRNTVVTDAAPRGCTAEYLVAMAVTADQCPVCPVKRKPGEFMIEIGSTSGTLGDAKADCVVAKTAILARGRMAGGHTHTDPTIVAVLALRGGVVILLVEVAGFAAEPPVGAIGGDAGGFVVVFFSLIVGRRYQDRPDGESQQ